MKRFVWNAAQSGRILRRHRMLALFLILQCALCLGMAGTVANQAVQSGRKIEDFQTRIEEMDAGATVEIVVKRNGRETYTELVYQVVTGER